LDDIKTRLNSVCEIVSTGSNPPLSERAVMIEAAPVIVNEPITPSSQPEPTHRDYVLSDGRIVRIKSQI